MAFNMIANNNDGVLEEFLNRVKESFSLNNKKSERVEELKKELQVLKKRRSKLMDSYLDESFTKEEYDNKVAEIDDDIKELDYQISRFTEDMNIAADYYKRIEEFKKKLQENSDITEFEREVFESVTNCVVVGGYDDDNNPDPTMLKFIFKTGVQDVNLLNTKEKVEKPSADANGEMVYSKLAELPEAVEVCKFNMPYKHFIFNKCDDGGIQKTLKTECTIKVAIAL